MIISPPHLGLADLFVTRDDTHMIKTIKSKFAEDALLISTCVIACLGLYFLAEYFTGTFSGEPRLSRPAFLSRTIP